MNNIKNFSLVIVLALSVIAGASVPAYAAGAPTTFSGVITDRGNLPLTSGAIQITLTNVIGQTITSANGTIGPDGRYDVTVPNYVDTCGIVHFVVSYGGNTYEKESTMGCYLSGKSYTVDLQYADIDTVTPTPAPPTNASAAGTPQNPAASITPSPANLQVTGSPSFSPGGNGSSNEPGNQTMQLVTPAPGNSSATPEVSGSNGTSGDSSQNASGSQSGVMGTPFPGALVTLLIAGGVCALLLQHRRF